MVTATRHRAQETRDRRADQIEHVVRQATAMLLPPQTTLEANPRALLSPSEAEALERGGAELDTVNLDGSDNPITRGIALYALLIETSLTVREVAALLRVNPSRVRQRLVGRSLFGIKWRGEWRLPRIQFQGERVVPDLDKVLPRLDPALDPISVSTWLTTPECDLEVEGRAVSPIEWLESGRSYAVVAELAANLL